MNQIDVLPDEPLLEIFDFYKKMYPHNGDKAEVEAWQTLVHVCRRWRNLVFGSPRRLNLQLFWPQRTPTRDILDVWPALPLVVKNDKAFTSPSANIIAAFRQSNRVCHVDLRLLPELEEVSAAMQVPFPELTYLRLILPANGVLPTDIPDSFLGGSAPRLRTLILQFVPFPGLPKLLLSATHLVDLYLLGIPHSGYIAPEAIVASLSVLTSLETLLIGFKSHPDRESRSRHPLNRSVLPALRKLFVIGVIEYLEELVTRIDTPQLDCITIHSFNHFDFVCPRLAEFIKHTPKFRALGETCVQFNNSTVTVGLQHRRLKLDPYNLLKLILYRKPDRQLSSVAHVCNSSLLPLSTVEDLYVSRRDSQLVWRVDATENTLWLQLLLPFTAVKNLYLSKEFAPCIVAALQELVGGRVAEVLPSLQNIFLEGLRVEPSGHLQANIGQFVAARQLSDHTIVISDWDKDSDIKST